MTDNRGDGVVKTTVEARQGSRNKVNLYALLLALALLVVIGAALYGNFLHKSPATTPPETSAPQ